MSSARKIVKEKAETLVLDFVRKLDDGQKVQVLEWSQKALAIREDKSLRPVDKIKALNELPNHDVLKMLLNLIYDATKAKVWTGQSWARRLGVVGFATGMVTFGGTGVGIATLGAGIGLPLMVMTAAGGLILGSVIDEVSKELRQKK